MIQDRKIALDLAQRWGNKDDVQFLLACCREGKVTPEDRYKVMEFWDKKFKDAEGLFWEGKVTLDYIKDGYSRMRLLQRFFGGRIIE